MARVRQRKTLARALCFSQGFKKIRRNYKDYNEKKYYKGAIMLNRIYNNEASVEEIQEEKNRIAKVIIKKLVIGVAVGVAVHFATEFLIKKLENNNEETD